jgi:hypothetical protein
MSVIRSDPMTSTYSTWPVLTRVLAMQTAWQKPAHAADTSNAAASLAPSRCATSTASAGVCSMWVIVAAMTQPSWRPSMPAAASALAAAVVAISGSGSSAPA